MHHWPRIIPYSHRKTMIKGDETLKDSQGVKLVHTVTNEDFKLNSKGHFHAQWIRSVSKMWVVFKTYTKLNIMGARNMAASGLNTNVPLMSVGWSLPEQSYYHIVGLLPQKKRHDWWSLRRPHFPYITAWNTHYRSINHKTCTKIGKTSFFDTMASAKTRYKEFWE